MKQQYEMTQEEMSAILEINKDHVNFPVMKLFGLNDKMSLAEKINTYWEVLGKKYNFKSESAEGSSRGKLFFLAEPIPVKSKEEIEREKYDSLTKIVKQLEMANYTCTGGPLDNSIAFIRLKEMAE